MKTITFKKVIMILALGLILQGAAAQYAGEPEPVSEAQFMAGECRQKGGPDTEARDLLHSKVAQILNRNSAAAAGDHGIFTVVAEITLGDKTSTSGLVQDISKQTGQLVLTALNALDNTNFYSVTVPLSATLKHAGADPYLLLVKSIKPTDPVYVRFIRTARKNIADHYAAHCDEAVQRARTMYEGGNAAGALDLLYAIPPAAPCADEARMLMRTYRELLKPEAPDTVTVERLVEVTLPPDTVVVEKEVAVEKVVEIEKPVCVQGASDQKTAPRSRVFVSPQGWEAKVAGCTYLAAQRQIRLDLIITSAVKSRESMYTALTEAISVQGETYREFSHPQWYYTYPDGVPVKTSFFIDGVNANPGSLAMVKVVLGVGAVEIEIRDLEVNGASD